MVTDGTAPTPADLARRVAEGDVVRYLFFWGHRPQPDGTLGRGCLSQWWPSSFVVDGVRFATAEHYMMWRKAMLFGDEEHAELILRAGQPGKAKNLGRRVRGFTNEVWVAHRFGIVVDGNTAKFSQDPDLARFLDGTGSRVLVEASPVDRIWGIGLAADDQRASHPDQWPGLNLLGFALMRTREILRRG